MPDSMLCRVVVYQYEAFWTCSPAEYGQMLSKALRGEEWRIPGRQSKRKPKWLLAPVVRYQAESYIPKDKSTLFIYMPCDWEPVAVIDQAWDLYDALGSAAAKMFPLCPWCGFWAAMARNNPVPLNVTGNKAKCPDCKNHFVLTDGGWEQGVFNA